MEPAWQSEHIRVNGMTVDVRATRDGVTVGRTVNGIYASDLLLTPEQAAAYGNAVLTAAKECRAFQAQG